MCSSATSSAKTLTVCAALRVSSRRDMARAANAWMVSVGVAAAADAGSPFEGSAGTLRGGAGAPGGGGGGLPVELGDGVGRSTAGVRPGAAPGGLASLDPAPVGGGGTTTGAGDVATSRFMGSLHFTMPDVDASGSPVRHLAAIV